MVELMDWFGDWVTQHVFPVLAVPEWYIAGSKADGLRAYTGKDHDFLAKGSVFFLRGSR